MTTTLSREPQARPKQAEPPSTPPILVSGLLDITDGTGVRPPSGYQRGPGDVYVPAALIKQYGLRKGDHSAGTARPARGRARARDKYPAAGPASPPSTAASPRQAAARPDFAELTPLHPQERLRLETAPARGPATARIIDLVTPIGKGQRGLIVSPPKAGKTMVLQAIAAAVAANHPEVHLMVVLVGERPEEVTDLRRTVRGEVVYSTFDQPAEEHIAVAELAIERAKRLVEQGRDVVVLLDSITRLGRAYNLGRPAQQPHPGRRGRGRARCTRRAGSSAPRATWSTAAR